MVLAFLDDANIFDVSAAVGGCNRQLRGSCEDTLVDAVENAEVAEIKRAVSMMQCALHRSRPVNRLSMIRFPNAQRFTFPTVSPQPLLHMYS
eukprot:6267178-Amphidinium_carterae.1